jgi:hypothetical protein
MWRRPPPPRFGRRRFGYGHFDIDRAALPARAFGQRHQLPFSISGAYGLFVHRLDLPHGSERREMSAKMRP